MKNVVFVLVLFCFQSVNAQKYELKKSEISFFSEAPLENITASTNRATGLFDPAKKQIAFSVPINTFSFAKKLMQEHFNEKYMETEKFPRGSFSANLGNFDPTAKGKQSVTAKGKLTLHGVTKEVEIPGSLEIMADNKIHIVSAFIVKLEDYNITRPQLVWQNLAEEVEVKVDFLFEPGAK